MEFHPVRDTKVVRLDFDYLVDSDLVGEFRHRKSRTSVLVDVDDLDVEALRGRPARRIDVREFVHALEVGREGVVVLANPPGEPGEDLVGEMFPEFGTFALVIHNGGQELWQFESPTPWENPEWTLKRQYEHGGVPG